MNYSVYRNQSGTEKSDLLAGWVAVAIYLVVFALLFLFVVFNAESDAKKSEISSGVLINFGNDSPGYGEKITKDESAQQSEPEEVEEVEAKAQTQVAEVSEPIADDKAERAVVKATTEKPKDSKPQVKPQPKTEAKPQPVVNSSALYKKKTGSTTTNSNESSSHGSSEGRYGKTGSRDGEIGNAGAGGTGGNFALSGRSLIGSLAKPDYDERIEGQIVIEIQVNREGKVTAATYLPKNSTISARKIIEAVRQAAMKTRFNTDNEASFTQVGTITYILKVE